MRRAVYTAVLALALSSCQAMRYEGDERSPYYAVPVGAQLTLNRELTIPPDSVGIYIQNGQLITSGQTQIYYPHCKFELHTRRPEARTIRPDTFEVTRRQQERGHTVHLDNVRMARATVSVGFGFGLLLSDARDDGPSIVAFVTRLHLRSNTQPEVFRLSCGREDHPSQNGDVTIVDIRRTLGDLFTLHLPRHAGTLTRTTVQ